jgi:hypothetical protein
MSTKLRLLDFIERFLDMCVSACVFIHGIYVCVYMCVRMEYYSASKRRKSCHLWEHY